MSRRRASITVEQVEQEIRVNHRSTAQIARIYGVSVDTVERRIKEYKQPEGKGKPTKQSAKQAPKEPVLPIGQRAMLAERSKKYDSVATKEDCIADLRKAQECEPDKFITRNFYRIHGKYSEKTWNRYFGTMEEFRSQAGLQLSRTQRHLEKHIAKHASLDESRLFYRLEIEPWVNKYAKFNRYKPDGSLLKVVIASDFHDIDVDLFVLEVLVDTCVVEQPDIIVLNGDIFDLYEFSHFDKDPRKINLKLRMEFVRDRIFKRLRAACPHAQIDLIIGNHDNQEVLDQPWASQALIRDIKLDGHKIVLCHYPIRSWNGMYRKSMHLFGHEHGQLLNYSNCCDVGADVWDFTPVTLDQILTRISSLPAWVAKPDPTTP